MKIKVLGLVFLFAMFVVTVWAAKSVFLVIGEEGSPVEIVEFKWTNSIKFKNISDKEIEAIEFRELSFDAFNRYMTTQFNFAIYDKKKRKCIPPQEEKKQTWEPDEIWETSKPIRGTTYTRIAFVSNVRFIDGSLWNSNPDFIIERIKQIVGYDLRNVPSVSSQINPW